MLGNSTCETQMPKYGDMVEYWEFIPFMSRGHSSKLLYNIPMNLIDTADLWILLLCKTIFLYFKNGA